MSSSSRTLNLVFVVMVVFLMNVSFQSDTMTNAVPMPFLPKCYEAKCKATCEQVYGSRLIKSYCKGAICLCDHTNHLISGRKGKSTL
ncbi:hypothetical protein ABFS82_06G191700 [Erythranthe guttata]